MSSDFEESDELPDIDWVLAIVENDVERLKELLKTEKSVNINDDKGNTPLHVAISKNKVEVFDYLMTVDEVRIDVANVHGTTPLIVASSQTNEYFALELIKRGADVSEVDRQGSAPLHFAAKSNSLNVGRILIDKGADINARNDYMETPLYMACQENSCDMIHMLLFYGADVDVPHVEGILPFDLVLSQGPLNLQEIFFDYTFDQEKIPVSLRTLTEAMLGRSPLFQRIIEKTSELLYDERDLSHLSLSLLHIDSRMFRLLIEKFEDALKDMFRLYNSLSSYVRMLEYFYNEEVDVVNFFYVLCDSPIVSIAVDKYDPYVMSLVEILIQHNISEEELTNLICCLLSYGIDITSADLNAMYDRYGYCELFKITLHMDIVDLPVYDPICIPAPALIYDVHVDVNLWLKDPESYTSPDDVLKLLKFFAHPNLKEYCLMSFSDNNELMEKIDKAPVMPSLVELGRNAARKYIVQKYKVEKSVHFFTVLRWMPIRDVHKAILSYEKELYKF